MTHKSIESKRQRQSGRDPGRPRDTTESEAEQVQLDTGGKQLLGTLGLDSPTQRSGVLDKPAETGISLLSEVHTGAPTRACRVAEHGEDLVHATGQDGEDPQPRADRAVMGGGVGRRAAPSPRGAPTPYHCRKAAHGSRRASRPLRSRM